MKENLEAGRKFKNSAIRQGWLGSDKILAALSGGGDSVAMLWLLHNFYNGEIYAAHIDHTTRNGDSHKDAEFAENLCREWGIHFLKKVVDVEKACEKGESFEMAARRVRYTFFSEMAEKYNIPYIALGHSADDLIETQIMNLFRGTGLTGLRGIPETRDNIVRPIIDFRRDELRALLTVNGVEWKEDYTNQETLYKRNKVRQELFPWIKKNLNENFEEVLIGLAKQVDEEITEKSVRAEKNLSLVGYELEPALAVWNVKDMELFTDGELKEMLRLQGKKLALPVLSRRRTDELLGLVRKGGKWRFQWACDIEVCYSLRGMGWLHRCDISSGLLKNNKDILPWWAR